MYILHPMKMRYQLYASSNAYAVGVIGNKNVSQITESGYCREFMIPQMQNVIMHNHNIFDKRIVILKITRLVSSRQNLSKLQIEVARRECKRALEHKGTIYKSQVNSFYDGARRGVALLNKLESIFGWPQSKLVHLRPKVKREIADIKIPTFLTIGVEVDKRWLMAPQLFSLAILLIRNGKNIKEGTIKLINPKSLNTYALTQRSRIVSNCEAYLREAFRYLPMIFKSWDKIFDTENNGLHNWIAGDTFESKTDKGYYGTMIYRNGISHLMSGYCEHSQINANFNKAKLAYFKELNKEVTNAKA